MMVLKSGGKVIGGKLTNAEKRAMEIEIAKETAEWNDANLLELDAIVLWWIRRRLGYGEKRLKEFYQDFRLDVAELQSRYELYDGETSPFVMTQLLLDEGFDIRAWAEELDEKR